MFFFFFVDFSFLLFIVLSLLTTYLQENKILLGMDINTALHSQGGKL